MFFTKTGRIVAWLSFIFGSFKLLIGALLAVGTPTMEDNQTAARRYFNAENTGETINEVMIMLVAAICLGIATEISRNIARG